MRPPTNIFMMLCIDSALLFVQGFAELPRFLKFKVNFGVRVLAKLFIASIHCRDYVAPFFKLIFIFRLQYSIVTEYAFNNVDSVFCIYTNLVFLNNLTHCLLNDCCKEIFSMLGKRSQLLWSMPSLRRCHILFLEYNDRTKEKEMTMHC